MSHEFNSPLNVILNGFDCTGISQINGLDDLCQGRPSKAKAKDLQLQGHKFWP